MSSRETLAKITTDSCIEAEEDEELDPEDAELLDDEDDEKAGLGFINIVGSAIQKV